MVVANHGVVVGRVGSAHLDGCGAGNVCIGIGRVADHQHLDVFLGVFGDRFPLHFEDGAVGGEQVGAFHAGAAWFGANQHADIRVLESDVWVIGGEHAFE